jgi:hypothetical protein
MGLLVAKTGSDFMSGDNSNVLADYDGRVRLASNNLFPDPGLRMFDEASGLHRYLELEAPPKPTHWAPYMRDKNKVKNMARQVLAPISLEEHTFDQEDELIHGPSPVDELRALAIAEPLAPDAKPYMVSDLMGLPEGYYCIAWGFIPDDNWNSNNANRTNPGPRSEPFYLAQGQGFLLATPTDISSKVHGLELWISEPRMDENPVLATQQARRAPMFAIARWQVRGLDDFVRVVGPFKRTVEEVMPLPEKRNLTFVGNKKDMPALKVREDNTHHKHDEQINAQVAYAFQTESGIGEVKVSGGWHKTQPGRRAIMFEPADFEMRDDNEETHRERKREREQDGKSNDNNETNRDNADENTDSRGREKRKKQGDRIRGWRPFVRFKATDDPDNPDDEHGVTEWYMIVDKGGKNAFKDKGQRAVVIESEPGKWPRHHSTELVRVNIEEKDESGVKDPTEAPEAPSGDFILDLNTSGLTPGKHFVKTSLFVVDQLEENESRTSEETVVDVDMGEGIRVRRPRWHNLVDNDDASEADLEDFNKPLGWDYTKPFPTNVNVHTPKRGGVVYEDNSNASTTYMAFRTPVATLRPNDTLKYILRFKLDMYGVASGKLQFVLEEYDMVDGVPQLINARVIRGWSDRVKERTLEYKLSLNQNDSNNFQNKHIRLDPNTKEIRLRFEGVGNTAHGTRNFNAEVSNYGVFRGWARPRKSKRLDARRAEGKEPQDINYPHGGYCVVVEDPLETNPISSTWVTYDRERFEDNTAFTANWTLTSVGAVTGGRGQDWAISDTWGWRSAKTTTGAAASYYIEQILAAAHDDLWVSGEFFIQTNNNVGLVDMYHIRSNTNTRLAEIGINTDKTVRLTITNASGVTTTHNSTKKLVAGDLGLIEIGITGAGTAACTVQVYLQRDEGERTEIINVTGVNMTGKTAQRVRVGGDDNVGGALWDFYYDDVHITDKSIYDLNNYTYQAGNSIEYYGPYDTPKTTEYGPRGVRVPVKGGETYTVAMNVSTMDVTQNTSVMRWRARDKNHKILESYDFVAKGLEGDTPWTRYTQTFTVPIDTAYIEWYANNIGAGTIGIHGIQLEKGSVATEYTDKNALSGYLSVYFRTAPEGMSATDPLNALALVDKIRSITCLITDTENTSWSVQYRSGDSLGSLGSYTSLVENLSKEHSYIEVKITLTSSSDTESPELRRVEIDLARPIAHLLRDDGTEYAGGVLVNNLNAEHPNRNVERVQFASGAFGDHTWGTVVNRKVTMHVMAWRPETVTEIAGAYGEEFVRYQTPFGRWTIRLDAQPEFETDPLTRIYLNAERTEFFQKYETDITGWIEAEEIF